MSEMVRVYLSDDYYLGAQFGDASQSGQFKDGVFEVPSEQLAHWEAAEQAWVDAQAEMQALIDARLAERRAVEEERQRREEARRAEIRAQLYGGRRR